MEEQINNLNVGQVNNIEVGQKKFYQRIWFALVIGCAFLIGGVMMVFMLPSPVWFTVVDLSLAYIPMAYLGGRFAIKITSLRDVVEEIIEDEKEEVLDSDLDDIENEEK